MEEYLHSLAALRRHCKRSRKGKQLTGLESGSGRWREDHS